MIKLQEYDAGDVVLAAGEIGRGFCILEDGVLEVVRDGKVPSEIDMVGSIFGELSEILGLADAVIQAKSKAKSQACRGKYLRYRFQNPKVAIKLIKTWKKAIQNESSCLQRSSYQGHASCNC